MNIKQMVMTIVDDNNLINVAFESFWENYNSYIIESPVEAAQYGIADADSVDIFLHQISYHIISDIEIIVIQIDMYRKGRKEYIGHYDECFDLNGKFYDECFVIEE